MGKLQLHRYKKSGLLINDGWMDCTHHEQYPKLLMNQETCSRKTWAQLAEKFRTKILLLPHRLVYLVVVADKKKDNVIGELKKDAVFKGGADFPVVSVPALQAKPSRKGGKSTRYFIKTSRAWKSFSCREGGSFLKLRSKLVLNS